jgi:hypothetical protein
MEGLGGTWACRDGRNELNYGSQWISNHGGAADTRDIMRRLDYASAKLDYAQGARVNIRNGNKCLPPWWAAP